MNIIRVIMRVFIVVTFQASCCFLSTKNKRMKWNQAISSNEIFSFCFKDKVALKHYFWNIISWNKQHEFKSLLRICLHAVTGVLFMRVDLIIWIYAVLT